MFFCSLDLDFPASVSPSVKTSIACGSFTYCTLFVIGLDLLGYAKAESPAGGTGEMAVCKSVDVVKTGWALVYHTKLGGGFKVHADPIPFGKIGASGL